ncbi:MAG: hypothetical protein LKH33_10275 [Acetobacter sp.]|jgi:hypothetical protein|nr:hypothetical protein [Acetobacter sp.]MCH4060525.1 hypothetical protein [Acetobacter sp.]MCH4087465.1 hypothetical protein [Acetobacter sp.]MCI1294666.1 hypothetical protein [Acetobacter sp.]MCI1321185.1 hypothetical protein [Acetobacter sp.]
MINLGMIWSHFAEPVGAILSAVGGWYGKITWDRSQQRKDALSAGQQALQVIEQVRAHSAELLQLCNVYTAQIVQLRRERYAIDDILIEIHAQALAARLIVHDLDAQSGRERREFFPLPPFPVEISDGGNGNLVTDEESH